MKETKKKAKALKIEEKSRNSLQRCGQTYTHSSKFFPAEPEAYKKAISSGGRENWLQTRQKELKSLCDTNAWIKVERPKDRNVIPGKLIHS